VKCERPAPKRRPKTLEPAAASRSQGPLDLIEPQDRDRVAGSERVIAALCGAVFRRPLKPACL
jgi:hypothetical protein